jgi:Domain of unknown function (DUF4357)
LPTKPGSPATTSGVSSTTGPGIAAIDREAAISALDAGGLASSGWERRMLRLADQAPVSLAWMAWTDAEHAYKVLREKLVREAAIGPRHDGRTMRFARDQVFASPSAAAAVVVGHTANGRCDWKIQGSGVSYGDWQAQGIDQVAREGSL